MMCVRSGWRAPHCVIQAFEVNAVDYLLKPYTQKRFDKSLEHALQKKESARSDHQMMALLQTIKEQKNPYYLKHLFIKANERMFPLDVSKVEYIKGEDDYIRIYSEDKSHLVSQILSGLLSRLDPEKFIRIHRSFIVNLQYIREIQKTFKGNYSVHMTSGARLPVGRTFIPSLKTHII